MSAFLIVHSASPDGRIDAYRQSPTLEIGGLRSPLDWGDVTLQVPAGDLPVTVFVTRASGEVEGSRITVRAPAGTGTRMTFVPSAQPGGPATLRIDGQWPSDSSMHYYAARDARVLAPPSAPAPERPSRGAAQVPAVGPTPGSTGSVPAASPFGHTQGARVDPVQQVQQPSFGQQQPQPFVQRDLYGREHVAGDRQPAAIPSPTEFSRVEREAADEQRRAYESWQEQQRAQAAAQQAAGPLPPSQHDGAPTPVGLAHANTGRAQAGWYADPFRRFELRWFDGQQWTPSVMRGGQRATDHLG